MAKGNGGGGGKPLVISGTEDGDLLVGSRGNDFLYGHGGDDEMYGRRGDDQLQGHSGDDRIFGEEGRDTLFGQTGHDELDGGSGNDSLWGGTGGDLQRGGTGADMFNFGRSVDSTTRTTEQVQLVTMSAEDVAGVDTILDFNPAEGDRIDISRIDAFDQSMDGFNDNAAFTVTEGPSTQPGTAWIVYDPTQAGHATLFLNQDGGSDAEFQLEIYGTFSTLTWGTDILI